MQARSIVKDGSVDVDFSTKKLSDLLLTGSFYGQDESGTATFDDDGNPRAKTIHLTSAQLWALGGGCTEEEAMAVVKADHDRRAEKQQEKDDRATVAQTKADAAMEKLRDVGAPLVAQIMAGALQITGAMTVASLKGILAHQNVARLSTALDLLSYSHNVFVIDRSVRIGLVRLSRKLGILSDYYIVVL